jgi:CBS domain-containing protein
MRVRDLMTKGIDAINPRTSVKDAARKMKELQTTLLPVATEAGLIGMLTARDIALRAAAEGRDPKHTPVEDVMSLGVIVCFEDQRLEEALETMVSKRVSQLPVLDRERHLVGRLCVEDLVFQPQTRQAVEQILRERDDPGQTSTAPASGQAGPPRAVAPPLRRTR